MKLVAVENIGTIASAPPRRVRTSSRSMESTVERVPRWCLARSMRDYQARWASRKLTKPLIVNGLRKAVKLRVPGGIKNGVDIIKYALFGADKFSFGQALMVSVGCDRVLARRLRVDAPAAPSVFRAYREPARRTRSQELVGDSSRSSLAKNPAPRSRTGNGRLEDSGDQHGVTTKAMRTECQLRRGFTLS